MVRAAGDPRYVGGRGHPPPPALSADDIVPGMTPSAGSASCRDDDGGDCATSGYDQARMASTLWLSGRLTGTPPMTQDASPPVTAARSEKASAEGQRPDRRWWTPALLPTEDRAFLAAQLVLLSRSTVRRLRLMVSPDTVLRWHRDLAKHRHARASVNRGPGRPRTVDVTVGSIRRLVYGAHRLLVITGLELFPACSRHRLPTAA